MSANVLENAVDLGKKLDEFGNMVKGLVTGTHINPETNSLSFIEDDSDRWEPRQLSKSNNWRAPSWATMQRNSVRRIPGYKKQFPNLSSFLREGYTKPESFIAKHKTAIDMLTKANAINTLDSESAGFAVLPEFAPDIAAILYENDILARTNQFTVSGNRMSFPKLQETSRADGSRNGGILGYWLEEGDRMTETRSRMNETELKLKKLCVVVFLTEELINDNSYALEQWVRQAVQREIAFMVGDSIFNGTGGGRPMGIINSPVTVRVAAEGGQSAATIVAPNVLKMYSRRRAGQSVADYAWFINQDCEPQLAQMTMGSGGQNGVVYLPPGGLSSTPYATLMGLPVIPTEFNSTCGAVGDIVLANFKNYLTISKGGVTETASSHVEFLRDQTAIKFTFRIDGRPLFDAPTTPYKGSSTQSDFICLAAR
jgi:HK97 family phage major capsid protein